MANLKRKPVYELTMSREEALQTMQTALEQTNRYSGQYVTMHKDVFAALLAALK